MMIERTITDAGLLNIGRKLRPLLTGAVIIHLAPDGKGILISPYDPKQEGCTSMFSITKFDQYNRVMIPSDMLKAADIKKRVTVSFQGPTLVICPSEEACIFCGTDKDLHAAPDGKYICKSCKDKLREDKNENKS